jgi:hypothetical protein
VGLSGKDAVSAAGRALAGAHGGVTTVLDLLPQIVGHLAAIRGSVVRMEGELTAMRQGVDALCGELRGLRDEVGELRGDVRGLNEHMVSIDARLANVHDEVGHMSGIVRPFRRRSRSPRAPGEVGESASEG